MIRVLATAVAAGLLLGAGQVSAADDTPAPGPPAPPPSSAMPPPTSHTDPNAVLCKRAVSTESRLGGAKICHTRQEWADLAAASRTAVGDLQRNSMTGIIPGK